MKNKNIRLPEIPSTRDDDIHNIEYMNNADLILFMAGNQFMVMDDLLNEFQRQYPDVQKVFYETLPPGLELKQILAGGAIFRDMVIDVVPDIYTSVTEEAMKELINNGYINDYFVYLHNRIVLMIPEGNPKGIRSVSDLARDEIRISQPGPMEDISRYIVNMYDKIGGGTFVKRIMEEKRAEGMTIFTSVHHRETPLRMKKATVDVGPVWATEVVNAIKDGLRVEALEPGEIFDQREEVSYFITKLRGAPNPDNAEKFLNFIKSARAQKIYKQYGFLPHFI